MRCPQCGLDKIREEAQSCPGCRAKLRGVKPATDEAMLEKHTRGTSMGRIRPATLAESESREALFRPDAVLTLAGPVPEGLSAFEAYIVTLIDGVRPVARLRKKAGVASSDLRIALAGLAERRLLRLSGIVEEALGTMAAEIAAEASAQAAKPAAPGIDDPTIPGGKNAEFIPPHVMAEIDSMLDEEEVRATTEGYDADTSNLSDAKLKEVGLAPGDLDDDTGES